MAEPSIEDVSVEDLRTFEFPLDPYLEEASPSFDVETRAYRIVFSRCMSRFGFVADLPPATGTIPRDFRIRRYGVADLDEARQYGYNNPLTSGNSLAGETEPSAAPTEPRTAAYEAVAGGEDPEYRTHNDMPIPEGGCFGEAERALDEGAPQADDPTLARALQVRASDLAEQDSRVVDAFGAWSECMSRSGYDYADPWVANNDPAFDGNEVTPEEIAVATTDVECKVEVDLVDSWVAVEVAYQQRLIEENAEALQELRDRVDARRRNAAEIVEQGA